MTNSIIQGKDFNYFRKITVTSADFLEDADAEFAFRGNGSFSIINEGTGTIEYSFNGNTVHGDMISGSPSAALVFNHRGVNKIWFRLASGADSDVRVEASAEGTISGGGGSGGGGGSSGGSSTITGPLGNKTKAQSIAVTLSTNEPALTVNQGTANTNTNAWPITLSDNTNIAGLTNVSGDYALKVDVIQTVGGGSSGSNFGSAIPSSGTAIGLSDGTNLQLPRTFDVDSGVGTQHVIGVNLRLSGSGGSVEGGTSTNPIRIDPTGTTTQPVNGTVTANIGTTNGLGLDSSITSLSAKFGSLGQKAMSGSAPVVIASDQSAIAVSGTVTSNIGTTNGLALDTSITSLSAKFGSLGQKTSSGSAPVVIASDQSALSVDTELSAAATLADATINPSTTAVGSFIESFNGTTWDRIRSGISTVVSSVTGWINVLSGGKYNAVPGTLTDGQFTVMQLDSVGNERIAEQFAPVAEDNTNGVIAVQIKPLTSSTYAPTITNNWGANITLNIKASAGTTFCVIGANRNAATRYLQLHNTATTPAGSAVPLISFPVATNSILFIGNDLLTSNGIFFSTGIAYGWSTTAGTYTAATASEHDTTILFK